MHVAVDHYLQRIGFTGGVQHDLDTLTRLQLAHLRAVPFENLHVFSGRGVQCDDEWTYGKIVGERRGGWCFEVNGAFAQLLDALGFDVRRLAAAVQLGGPNDVVDHLTLEVMLDQPYLVDVGFGDDAPIVPLPLGETSPVDGRIGRFQFFASPKGTTLTQIVDGVPEARYRFKRVHHSIVDFEPASRRLQADKALHWSVKPFATRILDDGGTRLTLTRSSLKTRAGADVSRVPVEPNEWNEVLYEHFGLVEQFTAEQLRRADGEQ